MSGGDHGVSPEDRQRTAADPISTEVRHHGELVDDNRQLELNALRCSLWPFCNSGSVYKCHDLLTYLLTFSLAIGSK